MSNTKSSAARTAIVRGAQLLRAGTPKSAATQGQMTAALKLDDSLEAFDNLLEALQTMYATFKDQAERPHEILAVEMSLAAIRKATGAP